jgi:hypothetical protein
VHRIRQEAAHRGLISCGTYYVVRRCTHQFRFVLWGSSCYIDVCGSPGGLLIKGGMM